MRVIITTQLAESDRTGLYLLNIERKGEPGFRGYATEAAGAVIAAARDTGRTRLWATVREWNVASFRVLEKNGFLDSAKRTRENERGDRVWMTRDLTNGMQSEFSV